MFVEQVVVVVVVEIEKMFEQKAFESSSLSTRCAYSSNI